MTLGLGSVYYMRVRSKLFLHVRAAHTQSRGEQRQQGHIWWMHNLKALLWQDALQVAKVRDQLTARNFARNV